MATATTTEAPTPLLQAHALACRRGERLLFDHLSLSLSPGQAVWVRGPNGQGKTSLLRLLAGLSQPAAGQVHGTAARLYIGHHNALKDDLTATEALRFLLRLPGWPDTTEAVHQALREWGVGGRRDARVRTLSQGQRRRVALARLSLSPPGLVWILDEPYDALDGAGVATLNLRIAAHRAAGGAVVLTSHQAIDLPELNPVQLDGRHGG